MITAKIREYLTMPGTHYFNVENCEGETVKIRVSDHSMNRQNNGDRLTLSFVSARTEQNKSAYNQSANEWAILENGLTDTYEEIEYILTENNI